MVWESFANVLPAFVAVAVLAAVHIYGVRLTFWSAIPRNQWLSLAGGVLVAYVFVHILPDLKRGQEAIEATGGCGIAFVESHVYLVALVGLATFYGLEHAVSTKHGADRADSGRLPSESPPIRRSCYVSSDRV